MVMSRPRPRVVAHRGGGDVDLDRDRTLVRRCQEGDGAAFAELYTEYHDRLYRFCLKRLPDREEAEEVTQEAFLRAWRALPRFAGDLRFYPWLTVIAKNLCTDSLRRRSRYGELADLDRHGARDASRADATATAMSSEETVMASLDGELAAEALTRLSERHRHVLALREEAGLSYQQIAAAEGVEISAVETLLWRARQALKREYAALSGTKVFGGVFVLGAGLRRLADRLGRKTMRAAVVARGVKLRDLALAGAVTAALAGVAATSTSAPGASPLPLAFGGGVAPATGTLPAGAGPVWTQVSTPANPPSTTTSLLPSPGAESPVAGTRSVGGAGSTLPPAPGLLGNSASPVPPGVAAVAGNLPTIVQQITSVIQPVTGNLPGGGLPGTGSLPNPPKPTGALPNLPSGLKNLLPGGTPSLPKL
jgi:RNA polymerase sigma-70 factor, ECF subfamily